MKQGMLLERNTILFLETSATREYKQVPIKKKTFFGSFLYLLMQDLKLLRISLCSQMRASHMTLLISSSAKTATSALVASDIVASSGPCHAILGSVAV